MSLIDSLEVLDQELMLTLNSWHHAALDPLMLLVSNKFVWLPIYLLFVYLLIRRYGAKTGLIILGVQIIAVLIADLGSVYLFKNVFLRYRPCHNELIKESLHIVGHCGGQYGFLSSHAANHFVLGVFMSFALGKKAKYWLLPWAVIIAYSRVYLGVHYPADIVCGAIWGTGVAYLCYWLGGRKFIRSI